MNKENAAAGKLFGLFFYRRGGCNSQGGSTRTGRNLFGNVVNNLSGSGKPFFYSL